MSHANRVRDTNLFQIQFVKVKSQPEFNTWLHRINLFSISFLFFVIPTASVNETQGHENINDENITQKKTNKKNTGKTKHGREHDIGELLASVKATTTMLFQYING